MLSENKKIAKKQIAAELKKMGVAVRGEKVKIADIKKITADDSIKEDQKLVWEKKLLKEALDVQNASNLLGVSKSFARALQDLYEHVLDRSGTEAVKKHPVTTLWADKIADLVMRPDMSELSKAYQYAEEKIK